MIPHRLILLLLLVAGLTAVPAAAQQPSDSQIAHWVADALLTDAARLAPESAQQRFDRAGLRADLDICYNGLIECQEIML